VTTGLARKALGELIGTAMLVAAVVGSGIAAQRLSPGDVGLLLFEHAADTAAALMAIIRSSGGLWLGETVATFGLLLVVFAVVRSGRTSAAPFAVGAYIGGAYFFTSSTSFANPAVTAARMITDTFAGIAPGSMPAFVAVQLLGAGVAVVAVRTLYPTIAGVAADVVVPHASAGPAGPAPDEEPPGGAYASG